MSSPHLVVSISGHGFGHVAQTAPVLNALHRLLPELRITVRSAVAVEHLSSRIHAPFTHLVSEGDIGMVMSSALDVCIEESRAAYYQFHSNWANRVEQEAQILRDLNADFILSNVGYLPLAGAQMAGLPNAAICSLNWADIYHHYCVDPPTSTTQTEDQIIVTQIHASYANADAFLRATPGMEMNNLPNLLPVAPIAAVGTNRREELNRRLKLSPNEKLVLISMGGIASRFPVESWPRTDGVRWLVQESWQVNHPDAIVLESCQTNFSDLLASCDALLSKPGYGSFVEAACSGIPVLYVNRPDWPESPALVEWLHHNNRCVEVSRSAMKSGMINNQLTHIWNASQPVQIKPTGAMQVANWLMGQMKR